MFWTFLLHKHGNFPRLSGLWRFLKVKLQYLLLWSVSWSENTHFCLLQWWFLKTRDESNPARHMKVELNHIIFLSFCRQLDFSASASEGETSPVAVSSSPRAVSSNPINTINFNVYPSAFQLWFQSNTSKIRPTCPFVVELTFMDATLYQSAVLVTSYTAKICRKPSDRSWRWSQDSSLNRFHTRSQSDVTYRVHPSAV